MKRLLSALLVASSCVVTHGVQAQIAVDGSPAVPNAASHGKPTELSMKRAGSTSIDLRNLPPGKIEKHERIEPEPPEITPIELPGAAPPPAFPITGPSAPAPSPSASFLGLDFANWGAGHPPDTNGDVGPTYFIETVNTSIGIYDKTTGTRVAAFTFNALMSQGDFGNLCDTSNDGDPVVLYDSFEDRWVISDFAFQTNTGVVVDPPGAFQCFAVSKSGDPVSGGWNFYSVNTTGGLGDYPKLGVWPDGIYMSVNLFNDTLDGYFNPRLYALNKAQMYAGAPSVQVVTFDAPSAEFTVLPANARLQTGTPPAGSPNYFAVVAQFLNAVSVYKFHVDWNSISTSTLTGPFVSLTATNWSQFAGTNGDVPSPANSLDTLYPRLMVQNQYTNIGGVESLWDSHTVGASGTTSAQAAVRYYQVKVTGGSVEANATQAFTWSPDATVHRFLPSVAVDRAGNMALGYSASSATLNPAIRYAGRLAGDAANTISQTETSLIEGTGSQSGTCGPGTCVRWGDYSSMSLDPDGCTFWMANEYYAANGLNWQTRIGAFKYPSCTTVASGSVQGTVTATTGGAPISGATVALGSRTTTTNGSGVYSFSGVPSGTYPSLTASAQGFSTGAVSNVVVTNSSATTQNFSLATAPTSACPADTTQADFQKGVPNQTDLTTSPGNVILLKPAVDQQNTSVTNSGFGFSSTGWFGQTFTAGATGTLTRVDLDLFCSSCTGTTPNITVSIRATSSNLPTGADLATATITGFSSNSAAYLSAVFGSPPSLTAGTVYAIVVRAVSNPSAGTYAYVVSSGSPYAAGRRVTSANSGTTWTGQTTDVGFKTYVNSGFSLPGDFVSSLKDSNFAGGYTPIWTTLSWNASTPASTSLKFQAAASNSPYGPFSFVGPDGTGSTFFTTSGGSLSQFSGKRYLQYRAFLATTNSAVTPALNDATVCYVNNNGPVADLSITKTDGVTTATPGGSVSYTITASNAGPSAAPSSTVSDTFPASLTCAWTCTGSAGGTCTASSAGNINDSVDLPNGGSVTYTASCTISSSATGSLANTATVTAPGGVLDPNPANNSATDTDTLSPQANLGITNTDGVTTATPGGSIIYTITAANTSGPSAAPGSTVTDTFPASLTCTWTCVGSNGGTCTASGSGNINDTVNLPKTGNVTYTASCNISASATGSLANAAGVAVAAGITDPTPGNNSATDTDTLTPQANLSITNTDGVTTATPGGTISYTITASNGGPSDAPGSSIGDTFPAPLTCTWTCVGSNGGTCAASGSGNIGGLITLPSGGSVTYTVPCTIAPAATGSLVNTAAVGTPSGVTDPVPVNNSATDTDPLSPQANLALTLSDGHTFVQVGDVLDYVIEVTNPSGPSTAVATVTDALPGQLTSGSWVCTPTGSASCNDGSGNALNDTATLPVGGKASYVYSATVQSAGAIDQLVNSASTAMMFGSDPAPGNNSATDTDTVVIFRDGFEGSAVQVTAVNTAGAGNVSGQLHVDAGLLGGLGIVPIEVASGRGADGKRLFTLQIARFGRDIVLRTLTIGSRGESRNSAWQTVDLDRYVLEFAWQSASSGRADGYFAVAAGGVPVLVDDRSVPDHLTYLHITVENRVPWLILIEH